MQAALLMIPYVPGRLPPRVPLIGSNGGFPRQALLAGSLDKPLNNIRI